MIVHLYTICWNESFIIPFFLRNYLDVVDKIVVFDNGSDDDSVELFSKHEKVHIKYYDTNGKMDDDALTSIRDNVWKESRDKADWTIIVDIDELLYHPKGLHHVLSIADEKGYTILVPKGFDMVSTVLPDKQFSIFEQIKYGFESPGFSKACIFKPDEIKETNYGAGAHIANPTGNVKFGYLDGLQLLHCKYLSYEYYSTRSRIHATRVIPKQVARGVNVHYFPDEQRLRTHFDRILPTVRRVVE